MELNYIVEGEGEAVVLIHGLSDNLDYWEVLASTLKNNFKVIRFDLRGHGKSPLGNDNITVDLYADDLKDILDELNVSKVNLVGFSLGGSVALDFAISYPSQVSSIVLMSSLARLSPHARGILNQFLDALEDSFEEFYDLILPMVLCPDVIAKNKDELDFLKALSSQVADIDAYKKAIYAMMQFDVFDNLCDIEVPMLVLGGKYDEVFLVDEQIELSDNVKNSKAIVFDDVKHNLLVGKNVVKVYDVLIDFFEK